MDIEEKGKNMELIYLICRGITLGVIVGFIGGGLKVVLKKKDYSNKQSENVRKTMNKLSIGLKYVTFLFLSLGLVWCCYFLILGIMRPEQIDYANNMAELIVSVLTVISIIFAFVEFLRRDRV